MIRTKDSFTHSADYNNGNLFVFLFISNGLIIDSTSDNFEDSNGTDERLISGDDKRDDDSSNNEYDRTCRQ